MQRVLKESLASYQSFKLRPRTLSTYLETAREVELIEQKFGIGRHISSYEQDRTYKKFISVLESENWNSLTLRDWKNAAYILFYNEIKLAADQKFIEKYKEWLFQQKSAGAWKKLIQAYLRDYDARHDYQSTYALMSEWIVTTLNRADLPNGLAIWRDRHKKLNLFDKNSNTKATEEVFLEDCKSEWSRFINLSGLSGELSSTGYINTVAKNLLTTLQQRGSDAHQNFRPFFEADNKLRFPVYRKQLVEALLLPWISSTPKPDYQKDLQNWLIGHFKDPRLPTHRQDGWRDISKEAISVFMRWQVGETIKQFFEIIDQLALEDHWKYRKKFWEAYNSSKHISDAWVVLGADARAYAIRAFGKNIGAGQISGGNHQSNHSVLMIRIGEYVFCEWSHMGKCRVWHERDPSCPKFYRTSYNAEEFRSSSRKIVKHFQQDGISHHGSETYSWQIQLSEFIRHNTGMRINSNDFFI